MEVHIDMGNMLKVGVITAPHGLQGEVRVYPTTDEPERFTRLRQVLLENAKTRQWVRIKGVKFVKNMAILRLEGFDRLEDVERLRQSNLWIDRKDALPLGEDEYFVADLIGLRVEDEDGQPLGRIEDVITTSANDVYQIAMDDGRSLLLPAIKQCVKEVHIEQGFMRIHILEGLLD